jgi:hypothetical protein
VTRRRSDSYDRPVTDAATPVPAAPEEAKPLARWRVILVWSLVAVASILLLISSLTIWLKRQIISSSGYKTTSAQLLQNSDIRATLATYMTDTLYERVDVNAILQKQLPPRLQPLAPVAAAALPNLTDRTANRLLASPRVQTLWVEANSRAHDRFIDILNGKKTGRLLTAGGAVVLDLDPLIKRIAGSGGLGQKLTAALPPDAGHVTILKSKQLDQLQKAFKVLKALTVFLAIAAIGLYALAIGLAPGRRRRLLRGSAVSFLFVGLLVLILRRLIGNAVVDSLVGTDSAKTAASAAWSIVTSMLKEIGVALIVYGAIGLVGAWLTGPTHPAVAIRRRLAPSFRERAGLVFGVVAFVYLLVVLWGPVPALQRWWGILLLGGLVFLGVWALRRETLREFPDAGAAT